MPVFGQRGVLLPAPQPAHHHLGDAQVRGYMSARHFFQQSGVALGKPGQLFVGALHPHGLHPLLMRYEGIFRDLLSYRGEQGKIPADALDVLEAQGHDMGAFQRLDIFYPFMLKKEALRRPADLALLYEP